MDDTSSPPNSPETLAARSNDALRALSNRAHESLAAQRTRINNLEGQLSERLDAIAEALTAQISERERQLEDRAAQLESEAEEFNSRTIQFDSREIEFHRRECDLTDRSNKLDEREQEISRREEQCNDRESELSGRETASELEQEPAHRAPTEQGESAELVHLRAERDALAEQVATLESRATETPSADSDQHLADLQRRCELAVEDLRELKTENAQLKQKLAVTHPGGATDLDDTQDWETQKRRLLATLENEGDAVDSQRRQQRASIESTIRITDDVVAEKDREIADLKERLANSREDVPDDATSSLATEAVDADEVVQQQRERLAQLEQEMQDKLRATELELSVQRAKVAREQAELAEWRTELEALRESLHSAAGSGGDGAPRRRWLAKLGLGSDDE